MQTVSLNGELFARMVESGAARLFDNRSIVNDLNVFPIPDGDTGDNMYMTIDSGATAVQGAGGEAIGNIAAASQRACSLARAAIRGSFSRGYSPV